jgi:hypothetical protein
MGWRVRLAVTACVLLVGPSALLSIVLSPGPALADEPGQPRPVRAVLLVDESGSLRDEDVAAERDAAALIVQSEFSPRSELAVVGFGSANQPGQRPVDDVCPLSRVDSPLNRDALAKCVQDLHRRRPEEGNDTDFANALIAGLAILGDTNTDQQKVIFLLTDGRLDVSNSPSWGTTAAARMAAANVQIERDLATAQARHVQVWPLGFGDPAQVDRAELDQFAAGGSHEVCGPGAPKPAARVVTGATDVAYQLFLAFGAARCGHVNSPVGTEIPSGTTVDLTVDVPAISTDGSIAVIKADPRITVNYFEPGDDHTPVPKSGKGNDGNSEFSTSGESSAVEVLRIVNPRPGTWRVRLTSGPGVPPQHVSATVIWQGNVQSWVTVSPNQPAPGAPVTVQLSVRTRAAALTDPEALRFLHVAVQCSGDGFAPIAVPMTDDGKGSDPRAGDGQYSGTLTVPSTASGKLLFTGQVSGEGIADSDTPFPTTVSHGLSPVIAQIEVTAPERVSPGGTVSGDILVSNRSSGDVGVRVSLTGYDKDTLVTLTSPVVTTVHPVGQVRIPVQLTFSRATKQGTVQLILVAADAADPTQRYDTRQYNFRVAYPPPVWLRPPWVYLEIAGGVLLVLLAAAVTARRMYLASLRDMRGMAVLLYVDGESHELRALDRRGREFPFIVRDDDAGGRRLDHALAADRAYVMTRDVDGTVRVQTPYGTRVELRRDEGVPVPDDLRLGYHDYRNRPVLAGASVTSPGDPGPADQTTVSRAGWTGAPAGSDDYNTI